MDWIFDEEYDLYYLVIDKYELLISDDSNILVIWDTIEKIPCETIPLNSNELETIKKEALEVFVEWVKKDIERLKDIVKKCNKVKNKYRIKR